VTDRLLLDQLVERVFGWRAAPDRFMTGGRTWIRRSRFRPFIDIRDAFRLADALTKQYSLTALGTGIFIAEVPLPERVGRASARNKARAISLAIADALGLPSRQRQAPTPAGQTGGRRGAQ
jgi:hypothetical protein